MGLLVYINISLTFNCYVALFHNHLQQFIDSGCLNNDGIFQQDYNRHDWAQVIQNCFEELISKTGLATTFAWHVPNWTFIEYGGVLCSYTISCTYKHWWAVDSYQDGTVLNKSLNHLWNWCHVELLYFVGLGSLLHDMGHLSHNFWHIKECLCLHIMYTC